MLAFLKYRSSVILRFPEPLQTLLAGCNFRLYFDSGFERVSLLIDGHGGRLQGVQAASDAKIEAKGAVVRNLWLIALSLANAGQFCV